MDIVCQIKSKDLHLSTQLDAAFLPRQTFAPILHSGRAPVVTSAEPREILVYTSMGYKVENAPPASSGSRRNILNGVGAHAV